MNDLTAHSIMTKVQDANRQTTNHPIQASPGVIFANSCHFDKTN